MAHGELKARLEQRSIHRMVPEFLAVNRRTGGSGFDRLAAACALPVRSLLGRPLRRPLLRPPAMGPAHGRSRPEEVEFAYA